MPDEELFEKGLKTRRAAPAAATDAVWPSRNKVSNTMRPSGTPSRESFGQLPNAKHCMSIGRLA